MITKTRIVERTTVGKQTRTKAITIKRIRTSERMITSMTLNEK